ncbi:VENN motif pre-toxin domain-containing protein [Pectobacterium aquaticum]|nr:VENN motif pre-toxin domain-containing protein [Pectobacterium aquaticum]MBN3066330.1 VENN motif pre-toxin domain-containing protein [Pectobacterium aquaticum]
MDIVRTEGELKAQKAAEAKGDSKVKRPQDGDSAQEWEVYKKALTESPTYKAEMQKYGTGSDFQRAAQAATAAIQALAGGDIQKAIASGASPYLAQLVKDVTIPKDESKITASDIAANAMAHAVVGAVVAQLSGQDAAAGAMGASSGELIARAIMADQYPGKTANDLTEAEKQSVSALSTLAAGLVSGLAGNSTATAASGAQSGRNAVENNFLSSTQALTFDKELSDCRKSGGDCQAVIDKWEKVSDEQSASLDSKCVSDPLTCQNIDKPIIEMGSEMAQRPEWVGNLPGVDVMTDEQAKLYVQYWNAQDLEKIDVNSPAWTKFATFISDPENQVAIASLGILGKDLVLIAKNAFTTKSLLKEMTTQGIKFTPENVVSVAKDNSGKIIFLEKGNSKSGLQHIVEEHGSQFAQIGIAESRIPDVVMKAATEGKIVGYQGTGTGRPIYETMINGKKYNIAVTIGNNGYIVGANLRGSVK